LAYIEGEWFLLRKVTAVSGGWRLDGLTRAQFGSTAATHAAAAPVFIIMREKLNIFSSPLLISGATLYAKSQPVDSGGAATVDESELEPVSFTIA
jgi:hypothetical protein